MADGSRRQQPGYACEECRRRKARCDRSRPTCGLCLETNTICITLDRKGAKKGRIHATRSQVESLDWDLNQQLDGYSFDDLGVPGMPRQSSPEQDLLEPSFRVDELYSGEYLLNIGVDLPPASRTILGPTPATHGLATTMVHRVDPSSLDLDWTDWTTPRAALIGDFALRPDIAVRDVEMIEPETPTPGTATPIITDHVRADLDQVFFDRVYPVLPIVYRRGYFSWADQASPGAARACLRSAMRTMAAAMSAPCFALCDQLYTATCRMLHAHTVSSKDDIPLEYIQAWLLLAHYELLRVGEHQALLTAARAFRLVLMARLHNIDLPGLEDVTSPSLFQQQQQPSPVDSLAGCEVGDVAGFSGEGFSAVEERRRTFWQAFQLDRLLCVRNNYPLSISENMITTRLPAPEANFQTNQHTSARFLSEAIRGSARTPKLSPFAECIVLASLHGRCTARGHDFWAQQKGLAAAVEVRIQALVNSSSPASYGSGRGGDGDDLLLFAHMLARGAVIKLASAAAQQLQGREAHSSLPLWPTTTTTVEQERAAAAAVDMARLAQLLPPSGCFKAHPFLPDPLACAADYLVANSAAVRGGGIGVGGGRSGHSLAVQHLVRVLKDMQGMNSLARGHILALDGTI